MTAVIVFSVVIDVLSEAEFHYFMIGAAFLFADIPGLSFLSRWLFTTIKSMLLLSLLLWKVVS